MSLRSHVNYRVHTLHTVFTYLQKRIFEFEHKVMGSDRANWANLNL